MAFKEINKTKVVEKDRSEVGLQFEEIFNDHHNPLKWAEIKIRENRKKRAEQIKSDVGM